MKHMCHLVLVFGMTSCCITQVFCFSSHILRYFFLMNSIILSTGLIKFWVYHFIFIFNDFFNLVFVFSLFFQLFQISVVFFSAKVNAIALSRSLLVLSRSIDTALAQRCQFLKFYKMAFIGVKYHSDPNKPQKIFFENRNVAVQSHVFCH